VQAAPRGFHSQGGRQWIAEVIQNADASTYPASSTPTLTFDVSEGGLKICTNDAGLSRQDVQAAIRCADMDSQGTSEGDCVRQQKGVHACFLTDD
jgi:hypothetical protein